MDYLKIVKSFLDANPNEVLTLLFTNPEGLSVLDVWKPAFDASGISHFTSSRSVDDLVFRNNTINLRPSFVASQAVGMADTRTTHRQWEASHCLPRFKYQYWPRGFHSSRIRNGGHLRCTLACFLSSLMFIRYGRRHSPLPIHHFLVAWTEFMDH